MARKKKPLSGPNQGYLVSFGDTMTALLAFFIVLNSLAEEQTGANLHAGTGSFIQALDTFGLPGIFGEERSSQAIQKQEPTPLYVVPDEDNREPERNPSGSDDDADSARIVDREQEQFHRFLNEMQRRFHCEQMDSIAGEVSFDILGQLPSDGALMPAELQETLLQLGPMLRRGGHQVELTVWATTPSQSAWTRAIRQADQLRTETVKVLRLPDSQREQLTAVARTWISSEVERPGVSLTLRRLSAE